MRKFYLLLLFLSCSGCLFAQQKVTDAGLVRLLKLQDSLQHHLPIEKLYIQTDKPFYAVGDTIWMKGYLFNADFLKYADKSGLIYIELANDTGYVVKRMMLPVGHGITHGQIAIDGKDIPEGSYILRAYTNWQRNFGENYVFIKNLYITGNTDQHWLVKVKSGSTVTDGKENIQTALMFADVDRRSVALRDMQLKVNDGNHNLLRGKIQTDAAGATDVNFNLPAKADAHNLTIQAEDLQKSDKNRKLNIPVVLNRPENTDLQFMPEGGSLVTNIQTKIGFKAISEDGKGVNISGKIVDSKQQEIASFSSTHNGMGNFSLSPQSGEAYTAKVVLPNGQSKSYPLPEIKNSGTILNIKDNQKVSPTWGDLEGAYAGDSLLVRISITPDMQSNKFYLTGKAREIVCYARAIRFDSQATQIIAVPKNLFPSGIAHFSLLNQQGQPLNERLVYIDHDDNLKISIQPDKQTYPARDSVALNIKVTDKMGKPIQGSFSLAVTDNEQVPTDSLATNLTTDLLLISDLKGTVEDPGYYLQNKPENKQALDNLLLTQGWVGYDWQQVTTPALPVKFDPELEFMVKGRVANLLNKKVEEANILLAAKGYDWTETIKADKDGRFVFKNIPITDSADFFLKAANKNSKDMGIGIVVDEPLPFEFAKPKYRQLPWYISNDTSLLYAIGKTMSSRLEEDKLTGDHILKQVEIKEKKIISYSKNLNGLGEADQIINEKEIEKEGVETLDELLELMVKRLRVIGNSYKIDNSMVCFVMDGILVSETDLRTPAPYQTLKAIFDSYPAKDILGIEVMSNRILIDKYVLQLLSVGLVKKYLMSVLNIPFAFIEITTRGGYGPFRKISPGTTNYRPLSFIIPKQFYRPRYTDKKPGALKDLRSTIHWEPLIITDKDGKATVSFYASDKPSNYTLIMEGGDMNGNIGSIMYKLASAKNTP